MIDGWNGGGPIRRDRSFLLFAKGACAEGKPFCEIADCIPRQLEEIKMWEQSFRGDHSRPTKSQLMLKSDGRTVYYCPWCFSTGAPAAKDRAEPKCEKKLSLEGVKKKLRCAVFKVLGCGAMPAEAPAGQPRKSGLETALRRALPPPGRRWVLGGGVLRHVSTGLVVPVQPCFARA